MLFHLLTFSILSHISLSHIIDAILSSNISIRESIPADRTYYIAAIDIDWDYAPNGTVNPFTSQPVHNDETASVYTLPGINRIGNIYRKAVYREYTDNTFTQQKERNDKWMHLGIMGPPIRAIVGERIKIIFYNKASGNYSMHPHGVEYNSLSEGAMYQNGKKNFKKSVLLNGGQKVFPGSKWIYIWDARDNSGGSDNEISSKFWFYHSHIDETKDTNTGLVGPIIITKKDYETDINNNNLQPNDIDREFITLFTVFNENESHYLRYNLQTFATGTNNNNNNNNNNTEFTDELLDEFDFDDEDFQESNLMHSMNGFVYNAIGKYQNNILKGETIRWYIGGMGTEVDIHSAHWHGNIIKKHNFIYEDVVLLMPSYSITVDMYADNSGVWFYHCHVNDHVEAGMISTYTVINKTCINCVAINSNNNNNKNSNINFDGISDVLSSNETWIIVLICFIINWIGFICILIIYKYCCNKRRNKKKEYIGVVEIKNDDLKESMLSNRKGTDLQMTENNFV